MTDSCSAADDLAGLRRIQARTPPLAKIRPADANGVHVANSPPLQIANSITGAAAAEPGALPLLSYLRT